MLVSAAPLLPPYDIADVETWLAALTQGTGTVHTLGPQAGGENTSEDRYDWQPVSISDADVRFATDGTYAGHGYAVDFLVTVTAADFGALIKRFVALESWIDLLFGPPQGGNDAGAGYKIGKSTKPRGGVPGASGWSCQVPVQLRGYASRLVFPPRTINAATVQVDAADANGAEQAIPTLAGDP